MPFLHCFSLRLHTLFCQKRLACFAGEIASAATESNDKQQPARLENIDGNALLRSRAQVREEELNAKNFIQEGLQDPLPTIQKAAQDSLKKLDDLKAAPVLTADQIVAKQAQIQGILQRYKAFEGGSAPKSSSVS